MGIREGAESPRRRRPQPPTPGEDASCPKEYARQGPGRPRGRKLAAEAQKPNSANTPPGGLSNAFALGP